MQVSIIRKNKPLPTIQHDHKIYVPAPAKGKYTIRLYNNSLRRRLVVLSVDGINVLNGEDAGVSGPGYVLFPNETVDVPGFRRNEGKVAAFRFKEQGESYAVQTGRGTSNVGVIGVAVFDELVPQKVTIPPPVYIREEHHHWPQSPYYPDPMQILCSTAQAGTKGSGGLGLRATSLTKDIGTGYGEEVVFHTKPTKFRREGDRPCLILSLFYATKEKLKAQGVPVDQKGPPTKAAPNPFPASPMAVPAPPGYQP